MAEVFKYCREYCFSYLLICLFSFFYLVFCCFSYSFIAFGSHLIVPGLLCCNYYKTVLVWLVAMVPGWFLTGQEFSNKVRLNSWFCSFLLYRLFSLVNYNSHRRQKNQYHHWFHFSSEHWLSAWALDNSSDTRILC